MAATHYCKKCNRTKAKENFYKSNNLEKYPDEGILDQCKECLTMHVDNWDPDTFLWILQEIDVPYIPDQWNSLLARYGRERSKVTGMTILGRYLSAMKIKQNKDYRWKDTEFLQKLKEKEKREAMKHQGFDAAEIEKAIIESRVPIPPGELVEPPPKPKVEESDDSSAFYNTLNDVAATLDFGVEMSMEEQTEMCLKWGKNYRPEEWVQLEKLYNEMLDSYDIQTAGHIDTLKLICKTSLKANQLIDANDVEGFQKMSKVYDQLMKSGKFTAAQNKAESGEYVDSVSELVAICETEGFIPKYYIDEPKDKADRVLQDLQNYTRSLVLEEMNLGSLIETAVKQIQEDKIKEAENEADAANDDDLLEKELFDGAEPVVSDKDFEEFYEQEEEDKIEDNLLLKKLMDGEI